MHALLLLAALAADAPEPVPVAPAATSFEAGLRIERGAMGALASWSVANLAVGIPAGLRSEDRSASFWLGNAAWNTVNLGIAGLGALGIRKRTLAGDPGPVELARQHRRLRTALAINAGLDIAYIATGLVLRGLVPPSAQRQGLGDALVLQGPSCSCSTRASCSCTAGGADLRQLPSASISATRPAGTATRLPRSAKLPSKGTRT